MELAAASGSNRPGGGSQHYIQRWRPKVQGDRKALVVPEGTKCLRSFKSHTVLHVKVFRSYRATRAFRCPDQLNGRTAAHSASSIFALLHYRSHRSFRLIHPPSLLPPLAAAGFLHRLHYSLLLASSASLHPPLAALSSVTLNLRDAALISSALIPTTLAPLTLLPL